ncbi:MAG: cbb3-type cytochrome oxidase assembly protein CcoS [Xanthomonadales bacterium]|nr:cbb3-type cytochrome oxidase assembly protein CcoS [Xanthomonadales bacterium]
MNILLVLVPISLVLLGVAIVTFVWAVRSGQFDDLDTPSIDILADDSSPREPDDAASDTSAPDEERHAG